MHRLALLTLLLLPACQTAPSLSPVRPPAAEARAESLRCRVPDAAFAAYAEDSELRGLLQRLDGLRSEHPHSAAIPASTLAERDRRGAGIFEGGHMVGMEQQYLGMTPSQRISYATQAMHELLASPQEPDRTHPQHELHSFDGLDVSKLRAAIGGAMAADNSICTYAYKSIMARLMLEDVAMTPSLATGTRCAAIQCLRHIYTEQACHADGANETAYLTAALPRHGAIPTLLGRGNMRFMHYSCGDVADRVGSLMKDRPCSADLPEEKLLDQCSIALREPLRDEASGMLIMRCSPSAYMEEADLLRAERQYKALGPDRRTALAKEVMAALLTQPLTPCHSEMHGKTQQLRSYDTLDVEAIRKEAGGIFAEEHPHAALLFKRMAARVLLEEVLDDRYSFVRSAAVECLRHICMEAFAQADGAYPTLYMVDALPVSHIRLEEALFGEKGAW